MANLKIKPLQDYYVELNSKKEDGSMNQIVNYHNWNIMVVPF